MIDHGTPHPGYPAGWKTYLAIRRKAAAFFAQHPQGTVKPSWDRTCDREDWARECQSALHSRINQRAGEDWRNETSQKVIDFRRDQRMLHDWLRHRIVRPGSGFVRPEMRNRFPACQARMTGRDD